jgi:N-methylhydantoinase A
LLGRRSVIFDHEPHDTPVVMRERLLPGARWEGPVIVEEQSATTVVPPGYAAAVDDLGNVLITREEA